MRITAEWIAGFFDGEGCFSANDGARSGRQIAARVQIVQKRREPLDAIVEFLGCGSVGRRSNGVHCLTIHQARDVLRFLALVGPHLIVKADAVPLVRELAESQIGTSGRLLPEAVRERRRVLATGLRAA